MYIIIAGGGKVGRSLTETLVNDGHEVLLIEKNPVKVEQYTEQLGGVVRRGDACEAQVLLDAGVKRADVVIAVTGEDEDNLVCCQTAKRKFKVNKTIARVNNPRNERIFRALGIDSAVSHTQALLEAINHELPSGHLHHMSGLRDNNKELISAVIGQNSPVLDLPLKSLMLPSGSMLVLLMRDGNPVPPGSDVRLAHNDELVILTPRGNDAELQKMLINS